MLNKLPAGGEMTPLKGASPSPLPAPIYAAPSAQNAGQNPDSIDLGATLSGLWRRRALMLKTFALVVAAGIALTLVQRPIYEATCSILISSAGDSAPSASDSFRALLNASQPRSVGTQLAIMRSYPVQRATLKRLSAPEQLIAKKFNSLEVRPQRDSDAIDIVAQSYDADVSANLANALSDEYMAQYQAQNKLQVAAGTKEVGAQLEGARKRLDEANNALKNYKLANGTVNLSEESSARLAQSNQIEITLRDLQAERAATVAQVKSLGGQIAGQPQVQVVPNSIIRSPRLEALRAQLTQLDLQRIATLRRYRVGSPEVSAIDAQIADVQAELKTATKTEISSWTRSLNPIRQGLSQDNARAQTQISSIDARIGDLRAAQKRAQAQEALLPEREYRLNQLTNDQTTLLQTYQLLNEKYQGLLVSEGSKLTSARPLAPAEAPRNPVKPRRLLNLAMSVFLGGALAVMLALLAEKMDDSVRSASGAASAAHLPVLAQIPALATSGALAQSGAIAPHGAESFSPLLENFRLLRTNLMQPDASGAMSLPRSILVTSSRQGEGKSGCALNLAIATALGGRKVILIDADLRHPTLATALGLNASRGLSEVVRGEISLDEALQPTEVPNLLFLAGGTATNGHSQNGNSSNGNSANGHSPKGTASVSATELLDSDAARQILQSAIARADCTVLNGAPVLGYADTAILSTIAQCALLVVSDQESQGSDLAEARDVLARTGITLPGLVLNRVKVA